MKFTANISRFEDSEVFWTSIIIIPNEIYLEMIKIASNKRIICSINNSISFHCGMLPKNTFHYIMLSKEKIKILNLKINDEISVEIFPDESEFGMEMCEELQEVLFSDPDGNSLFEKLTSGKKRSIIYLISKTKNSQLRIEKSFVFIEHLKRNKGKIDFRMYQDDCRNFREKNSF
jgi:Bacteriocin-protection, YdeI or OmpD-Associated